MEPTGLTIQRDPSGAMVHLRNARGSCIGCIEAGLFDLMEQVWKEQMWAAAQKVSYGGKQR